MGFDRLGHISLLAIESDVSISNNDVNHFIDYFALLKNRKISLI